MAPDDTTARGPIPLGPVGGYLIENLKELRARRRLNYKDLSERLEKLGRPIPTLGLSRIEKGNRRVDADDLVALAVALGCTPNALLLPPVTPPLDPYRVAAYALTPEPPQAISASALWSWATGEQPLDAVSVEAVRSFIRENRPHLYADYPGLLKDETHYRAYKTLAEGVQAAIGNGLTMSAIRSLAELAIDSEGFRGVNSPVPVEEQVQQPVVAAIVTSELGVLIGRRNDGKPPWTFIAGEIEPGESPEDAGVREVKEETGLLVRAGAVIGERVHPKTGRTMIYMAVKPTHGTDVFVGDEDELAEVRWVSLAEADELLPGMFEPVREHLARELAQD
jgi:8-oxo-dGTP pyrophosphatase MutT (NUDIX family)/transcriptional regulator with XRE-family HTH domain